MAMLNDTQLVLLSTAAQHETNSLYPLPASMLDGEAVSNRAAKAITQLLKRKLLEKRATTDAAAIARTDNDVRYGIFITAAGVSAIGVTPDEGVEPEGRHVDNPPSSASTARRTKSTEVVALLQREEGRQLCIRAHPPTPRPKSRHVGSGACRGS